MLKNSNIDVSLTKRVFKNKNLDVEFLSPTRTGLDKGYMDAVKKFRLFLKNSSIHNFEKQNQGQKFKKILQVNLHSNQNLIPTKMSLYRPKTGDGDPRIGIFSLKKYCKPTDLIAFTVIGGRLEIINCSSFKNLNKYLNNNFIYQIGVSNNLKNFNSQSNPSMPKGRKKPQIGSGKIKTFNRDPAVEAWVLNNSKGVCESCKASAPFLRKRDGSSYLEIHHVKRLADGGSDTVANAIAICPNCHREFHYGINMNKKKLGIYKKVKRLKKE